MQVIILPSASTLGAEVKFFIHTHYLKKFIKEGASVLEVGAGAGRFTQVLADLGAIVSVADISPRQLELNRQYSEELGFAGSVKEWRQLDICEMGTYGDETFEAVVAYGGPLSYVYEKRDLALWEILRVLKPGGKAFLSVMTLWGGIHELLPGVFTVSPEKNREIIRTGDLYFTPEEGSRHGCHLFRAGEFRDFLEAEDITVLDLSGSNCLSTGWGEKLQELRNNQAKWDELLQMELEACRAPGCLDMGSHLIAVIEKSA